MMPSFTSLAPRREPQALPLMVLLSVLFIAGCSATDREHPPSARPAQVAAPDLVPEVSDPRWTHGSGPVVGVDAAHNNFHTLDDRYAVFGELLGRDGFRVRSWNGPTTLEALAPLDVLVISNAQVEGDAFSVLPTESAFSDPEIETLFAWVEEGGALFLIADHMPLAGAAAALAERFGVLLTNGYTYGAPAVFPDVFTRDNKGLSSHPIVAGPQGMPAVEQVASFVGNGFQVLEPDGSDELGVWEPILTFGPDAFTLMAREWGELEVDTPRVRSPYWHHGGVRRVGSGRIAIFGEAAMFTSQRAGDVVMGMGHPEAIDNARLTRYLLYWLCGDF